MRACMAEEGLAGCAGTADGIEHRNMAATMRWSERLKKMCWVMDASYRRTSDDSTTKAHSRIERLWSRKSPRPEEPAKQPSRRTVTSRSILGHPSKRALRALLRTRSADSGLQ